MHGFLLSSPRSAGIQYVAPVHEFPEDKWNQVRMWGMWTLAAAGRLRRLRWLQLWSLAYGWNLPKDLFFLQHVVML